MSNTVDLSEWKKRKNPEAVRRGYDFDERLKNNAKINEQRLFQARNESNNGAVNISKNVDTKNRLRIANSARSENPYSSLKKEVGRESRARNLMKARNLSKMKAGLGGIKQAVQTLSLAKQIDLFKDYPYIPALFAAILKDILDFTGIGSLPAIGTAVGICVSIFIFFMMLLAGSTSSRKKSKAFMTGPMKRYVALLGGTIVEMLFGLNFFPIQTAILIYSYYLLLKERKENQGS